MKDSFGMVIKGIKCDNCDYKDDNVSFEDYPKYLNRPCPKCGANLLTQSDLDTVKELIEAVGIINRFIPKVSDDEKEVKIPLHMNGTGKISLTDNIQ